MSPETIKMVEKNIADINPKPTDRQVVVGWLSWYAKKDAELRHEVIAECETSKEAREYWVWRATN